eukprot:tig00000492_g1440.t1
MPRGSAPARRARLVPASAAWLDEGSRDWTASWTPYGRGSSVGRVGGSIVRVNMLGKKRCTPHPMPAASSYSPAAVRARAVEARRAWTAHLLGRGGEAAAARLREAEARLSAARAAVAEAESRARTASGVLDTAPAPAGGGNGEDF